MSSTSAANPLWATIAAVAAASGVLGYFIGVGSTLPISRTVGTARAAQAADRAKDVASLPERDVGESDFEDEEESDEDIDDGELGSIKAVGSEPCKLVLVVRTDLQMTKGKIAAQCGHATLACYKSLVKANPDLVQHWERTGQAKIAVKCDSEEDMLLLEATAKSLGLCARSIQDAGRTQVAAGSRTVLGIGPAPVRLVNEVTSHLKLL